ncbi:MAG: ABC transporter substrate-binding protein [Rhodospirillales bacterium]|nr:ABC transporter substrate-binding protein [Rhodospirillales bacterium]MDE2200199.1 ABC transporter substrate-binding protein [Rhodospirillales bacterium]MDE2576587.1 ABC transporter substrate-binding protein [Rhodospirillales bacterium]
MQQWKLAALASAAILASGAAQAQVKVGFVTSLSGPIASIGVPYAKGLAAWEAGGTEVAGQKITTIQIDDASDPAVAARAAKKLIEEDHVDVLVGTAGTPGSLAMYGVAAAAHVPMIITGNAYVPGDKGAWEITVPQPVPLMISADLVRMKAAGVKTIGYIGYNDGWGDLVYKSLLQVVTPAGIKVIMNERYARADTSVTPQILKIMAAHPDAVFEGGSGSPGALPHLALYEHGYHGHVYATHSIINSEFVRVGGKAVDGLEAPTGPVVVAEQLPDSNPIKAVALHFKALYLQANKQPTVDAFPAYAYDAMLLVANAVKVAAPGGAKPGTQAYRDALHTALINTKDLVGTHAVYTFHPGDRYGVDDRSRVVVRLEGGAWKLVK